MDGGPAGYQYEWRKREWARPESNGGCWGLKQTSISRGVTIQKNICGKAEATWEIHQSSFGSVEAAIQKHWTLLKWMSQNAISQIEQELDRLEKEHNKGKE